MSLLTNRKLSPVLIILVCSVIILFIKQPWKLFFLNDDFEHIPLSNGSLLIRKNFIRPVANLFLVIDRTIYGVWAPGYFLTTWLLHTSCVISIYYLVRESLRHYNITTLPKNTALTTALLFQFYPFHAEPLFWIIGRGAVIAALFTILSMFFFLRKNEQWRFFILALILFMLALFTYESTWNIVLFFFLTTILNIRKFNSDKRKELTQLSIVISVFIFYLVIRILVLDSFYGNYEEINQNIYNIPLLVTNLIKLTGRNFIPPFDSQFTSMACLVIAVTLFSIIICRAFKSDRAIGWLMIFLGLGIITGVATAAPLGISTHTNESERYIYYSSFFLCFFIAIAISLITFNKMRVIITLLLVAVSAIGLSAYNSRYIHASAITRSSLRFIAKYRGYNNTYFIDVPGQYKGALTFRVGLPEAIKWIVPSGNFDSIVILSNKKEILEKKFFKTGEIIPEEAGLIVSGAVDKSAYTISGSNIKPVNLHKSDILFKFTDSGLYKINFH